jgi:predicted nucleic acid-binding protein
MEQDDTVSVVLDANIVAALVIPLPYSIQATHRMTIWQTTKTDLFAPTLLEYEIITVLRQAIVARMIDASEAIDALENVLALGIRTVVPTKPLHNSALRWSELLNQKVAYDAQYLALAEQLGAQFWTADQRLTNGAQQVGVTWVHWIGEKSDAQAP